MMMWLPKVPIEERLRVETLATVIINFESDGIDEYDELVRALYGIGSYKYAHKKLDLNLKNRCTPPSRPSIEEPSVLEFKAPYLICSMHSWGPTRPYQ